MTERIAPNNRTTLQPSGQGNRALDPSLVVLTILSHPDPRRIGERSALTHLDILGSAELARHTPSFSPPGSPWSERPLEDPFLSRKPWRLTGSQRGLELVRGRSTTAVHLDGRELAEAGHIGDGALNRGVTLELGGRVAMLLHRASESALAASDAQPSAPEMVGASPALAKVRSAIDRVADLEVPVLIRGETGTGKELVARALHRQSARASRPFVAVDLGGLSPALASAELFGHAKGAFTGAHGAREGFLRAADGGTLFLDEVGEATPEIQAMLLRVLETRQVLPVGSHLPIPVDIRLIAATDAHLEDRVQRGEFKEPLFHRLAAYVVELPPLRERRDDIGRLFVHLARPILRELGEEEHLEDPAGQGEPWLPADLMARLARGEWSGNIRQLANVVRQLVIDSREKGRLQTSHRLYTRLESGPQGSDLEPAPSEPAPSTPAPSAEGTAGHAAVEAAMASSRAAPTEGTPCEMHTEPRAEEEGRGHRRPSQITDAELEEAMSSCDFKPASAARLLGIGRPSLYKLVRLHPSLRLASEIPAEELARVLEEVDGDLTDAAFRLSVSRRALGRRLTELGFHGHRRPKS